MFAKVDRGPLDGAPVLRLDSQGFALPTILVVILLLSTITVTALRTAVDERMTGKAMRESAKAIYAAEAGVNAVIAGWDNAYFDSALAVPGDSLDMGWQSMENSCSYRAMVHRLDDGSGRKLYQVNSTGRGSGSLRGQRTLAVVLADVPILPLKALVVNGDIDITGDQEIQGSCGDVHVNGNVDLSDTLQVNDMLSATGAVTGSGANHIINADGEPVTPESGAEPIEIPKLNPWDFCGEADYILRNGWIVTVGPPTDSTLIGGPGVLGWKYTAHLDKYTLNAEIGVPGTVCVNGNVQVSAGEGTMTSALPLSLLVDGSVNFTGSPVIIADHSDGILVIAGGDASIHGYPEAAGDNFSGLIYAGSQCDFNGIPILSSQVLCRGDPDPAGAINLSDQSMINGETQITFSCVDLANITEVQPLRHGAWSQFAN
jgi:Tfp pilus assembly protein PilX